MSGSLLLTDRGHHELHAIDVLYFTTCPKGITWSVDRNVHIASKRSLGIEWSNYGGEYECY